VDQESAYIQQIILGDASRFSWFVTTYKDIAFSLALRLLENEQDAEEVVQDAFLRAFRSIGNFKGDSKFSTWLYSIVVNLSFTRLKKRKSERTYETLELAEECFDAIETGYNRLVSQDRTKLIEQALGRLPPEDRLILTLYYLEEQSLSEIASITGINKENVKMKLHRARRKMYGILSNILKQYVK